MKKLFVYNLKMMQILSRFDKTFILHNCFIKMTYRYTMYYVCVLTSTK